MGVGFNLFNFCVRGRDQNISPLNWTAATSRTRTNLLIQQLRITSFHLSPAISFHSAPLPCAFSSLESSGRSCCRRGVGEIDLLSLFNPLPAGQNKTFLQTNWQRCLYWYLTGDKLCGYPLCLFVLLLFRPLPSRLDTRLCQRTSFLFVYDCRIYFSYSLHQRCIQCLTLTAILNVMGDLGQPRLSNRLAVDLTTWSPPVF